MNNRQLEALAAELGNEEQRTLFSAGRLPEEDLLTLARAELFRPLAAMPRWAGRDWSKVEQAIAHSGRCWELTSPEALYLHDTAPIKALTLHQWDQQAVIHRAAAEIRRHRWIQNDESVVVVDTTNTATCHQCSGSACRHVIRVSVAWAGRSLVREYVL